MMRFGHPLKLVSDRGTHFLNDVIVDLTTKYLIKHRNSLQSEGEWIDGTS
jgi:hypothetical protein